MLINENKANNDTKYLLEDCKGFIFGSISTRFWM